LNQVSKCCPFAAGSGWLVLRHLGGAQGIAAAAPRHPYPSQGFTAWVFTAWVCRRSSKLVRLVGTWPRACRVLGGWGYASL